MAETHRLPTPQEHMEHDNRQAFKAEMLDRILTHCCANGASDDQLLFRLEGHCINFRVSARVLKAHVDETLPPGDNFDYMEYEVVEVTIGVD